MSVKALGSKHEAVTGQYTYRMVIGRSTGDAEQTSIEIIANADELLAKAALGYDILDRRMFIQNERYQAFMKITSELPPELMIKVRRCNDLTFGRITLDQVTMLEPKEPKETESAEGQEQKAS